MKKKTAWPLTFKFTFESGWHFTFGSSNTKTM